MSPALTRGWRKAARTVIQIVASGGLTAAVDAIAGGLDGELRAVVAAVWLVVVTFAQNSLETSGKLPVLLPSPGLVPAATKVVTPAVGPVEATAEKVGEAVGEVTGTVESVTGELLGEVVDVDRLEEKEE